MRSISIRTFSILTILLGFASLSACIFPGVYKLDIQQGNIVTQDMLDKLKPGMTERQVIYVMGNAVLNSPFQDNRWDYLYTLEERDQLTKHYLISLYFDQQKRFTHYTGELPDAEFSEKSQLQSLPQEEQSVDTVPIDYQ